MVVDVGGGTAEAVAFCFGGVLTQRTSKVGGDEMTVAVARYLREQHQLHVSEIIRALTACFDDLPSQALADVLAEGVLVFGGASLIPGFTRHLEDELGLPVKLAEEPLTCVAEGAARALRNRALLSAYGRS